MAQRTFFGTMRIAILLAVLLFVATGAWLDRRRSTDWDSTLRVTVYPVAADTEETTRRYVGALGDPDFDAVEAFMAREAQRYGVNLDEPVRIRLSRAATAPPPAAPDGRGWLRVAAWSLRLRYWAWRVAARDPLPTPDVQVFALYHGPDGTGTVPDSLGLSKGLMAVTHLYAEPAVSGSNGVVLAHELLHTLGASDKYDPSSGRPLDPDGLGDPDQVPRFPQHRGEIMAGRIALSADDAEIPRDLAPMLVGPATAREIGWSR